MTSVQAHAHTSSTIVPRHPLALFPPRPFKSALPPPRSVSPSPAPSLHSARYPPFQPVTPFLSLAYMRHAADSGRRPTASPKPTPPPLRCGGGLRAARLRRPAPPTPERCACLHWQCNREAIMMPPTAICRRATGPAGPPALLLLSSRWGVPRHSAGRGRALWSA